MTTARVYKWAMRYRNLGVLVVLGLFISVLSPQVAAAQSSNLFANPSVETASGAVPASWSSNKWGTTVATFTYPSTGAQNGTRFVKTQVTTKGTGDAKWHPAHVTVTPGQNLTFSNYYQSSVQSFVEVEYKLTNGSYQYVRLATLAASASWKQYQTTFTVPANAQTLTVYHFIQATGSLSVDNYSLTGGTTPPPPPPTPFTYSLSNTGNKTVAQGASVTNAVTATLNTGTGTSVNFSASGLPSGVTAGFSQSSCSPTCSTTLTLTASASATVGTTLVTVSGTSGTTTKTTTFNLTVTGTTPPPTGGNLFLNPSVETVSGAVPASWASNTWGGTVATFSYPSTGAQEGSRAVRTQVTNPGSGDAKWYPAHVVVTPGQSLTFSNYSQATVPSTVTVEYILTNNTYQYEDLGTLPVSAAWQQFQKTFTVPANVKSLTVYHHASAVGTLTVDNYSLTVGGTTPPPSPPPSSNVVLNPSFESEAGTLPASWATQSWGTNNAAFTYVKNAGRTGTHSAKVDITTYTDGDAKWMHNTVPVTPGDSYRFSDWYQATTETYVIVDFTLTSGTHYYLGLRATPASASWKEYTEAFEVPYNATHMSVFHILRGAGSLTVDDYSLTKITPAGFTRGLVTITFDDGWEHNTTSALPVLNNKGFDASYYFATQFLTQSPATGPINVSGPQAVSWIKSHGHEVGSHTVTHPNLVFLTPSEVNTELTNSKQYLEGLVGAGMVRNIATPYGTYSDQVISQTQPLYDSLRSTDEGYNSKENFNKYKLKVQNLKTNTTLAEFQSWVNEAKNDKSWLVLVYHEVSTSTPADAHTDEGAEFHTLLADFNQQMNYLQNSGVPVRTTDQALQELLPQMGMSYTWTLPNSGQTQTGTTTPGGNVGGGGGMVVGTSSLSITVGSTPAAAGVPKGVAEITLATFNLAAVNDTISISSLPLSYTGAPQDILNCKLWDSSDFSPVGTGTVVASGKTTFSFSSALVVQANTSKNLILTCDIAAAATSGNTIQFGLNSGYGYTATGSSGTITPSVTTQNGPQMSVL